MLISLFGYMLPCVRLWDSWYIAFHLCNGTVRIVAREGCGQRAAYVSEVD